MRRIRLICVIAVLGVFAAQPLIPTTASQSTDRQVTILHTSGTFNRIQEFGPPDEPAQGERRAGRLSPGRFERLTRTRC
jgi:hypothetical protein